MKKIFLYVAFLSLLAVGLVSCGDNIDFSKEHVLSDAEIKEMARQDSVKEAQKNHINADLVLNYSLNIITSKTVYDGAPLTIDLDKIAKLFSITKDELLKGIAGESGAPEIKGFAIEGSTHADNATAANTNSPWGHWWDANGNVTTWGTTAMVFCEFDTETGIFNVGQYPAHLTDGQTLKIIECLKYNEKRAAVVITINAKGYIDPETAPVGDPKAAEKSIELTKPYSNDYASVKVDVKDLLRDAFKKTTYQINVAMANGDLKLYQGAISTTDPVYTADAPGYWLKADGTATEWKDGLVWVTLGHSNTELYLYGGNHPDNGIAGTTVTTKLIAAYNGVSVTFNLTFKVTNP